MGIIQKFKGKDVAHSPAGRFAKNAFFLIAVNLFMRTVGVSFNVYLSGKAGTEVMGLHSLLMGVYGLAVTLGCGGVHLGTTRLIAEAMGQCPEGTDARRIAIRRCLRSCLLYAAVCGVGACLLLYVTAPLIGRVWLGDARTVPSLRILALSLPPIALSSCLSGYFTGMRRVGMNATAGVLGQVVRLCFCVFLIDRALPRGIEATCRALVLGGTLAEVVGLLLSCGAYLLDRRLHASSASAPCPATSSAAKEAATSSSGRPRERRSVGTLLGITVPVTLAACLRSGLITWEHALIPRGLQAGGASWTGALSSYGIFHGVVMPVVLFPSAFISSFSGLLVPEVAECCAAGRADRVPRIAGRVILPTLIFSFGVAGLMACFSEELGRLVCGHPEAGGYIRALAPLVPIMYVDSSVDGILKGMGEQVYSMVVNIVDALVSVILVWLLLPRMGLDGFIVTVYVTETLNTTLSLCRMLRVSRMKVSLWRMVFGPLLCIICATRCARLLCGYLPCPPGRIGMVIHLGLGGILYLILLLLFHVIRPVGRRAGRVSTTPRDDSVRAAC